MKGKGLEIYLDASVFILPVLFKGKKAYAAKEILSGIEEGKISAATSTLTLDEVIWAIWRERGREIGVAAGRELLRLGGLKLVPPTREILATAFRYIDENELKPRDAMHAATMEVIGLNEILSEDDHFDRVGWIRRYPVEKFEKVLKG